MHAITTELYMPRGYLPCAALATENRAAELRVKSSCGNSGLIMIHGIPQTHC